MIVRRNIFAKASQLYTFASHKSQRADQSLQKSMSALKQGKFQNIFSSPSKKIKTPDTLNNPTKTRKVNKNNGLQTRTTERQLATAVWIMAGALLRMTVLW
jgi:hypothetical protein